MGRAAAESGWQALARSRGPLARLLWPLSLLYGALLARRMRRAAREPASLLPVPVVVVGNVVVGGAGKTPTTLAVVAHLCAQGWRPGVISRGYGRRGDAPQQVDHDSDPAAVGDEPLLIRRVSGVPVWVGRSRMAAAHGLLRTHPQTDVLVCDDGLQHLALHGDVRIVVFDDRGLGNGWLLPAGLLREPWPIAQARRAPQLMLQHRGGDDSNARVPAPAGLQVFGATRALAPLAIDRAGGRRALASFTDRPVLAIAAVARPQRFFDMLQAQGVPIARTIALPDHAGPDALVHALQGWTGHVLCTQKDIVKLGAAPAGASVWAVPLELSIDGGFFIALDTLLAPYDRGHGHQTA